MRGFAAAEELRKAVSGMQAELGARIGEAASSRSEEMPLSLSLQKIVQKLRREERGD
jgi:hypothetical protein